MLQISNVSLFFQFSCHICMEKLCFWSLFQSLSTLMFVVSLTTINLKQEHASCSIHYIGSDRKWRTWRQFCNCTRFFCKPGLFPFLSLGTKMRGTERRFLMGRISQWNIDNYDNNYDDNNDVAVRVRVACSLGKNLAYQSKAVNSNLTAVKKTRYGQTRVIKMEIGQVYRQI